MKRNYFFILSLLAFSAVRVFAANILVLPFTGGISGDAAAVGAFFANQKSLASYTVLDKSGDAELAGLSDDALKIATVANTYQADYVVSGSIQKMGQRNLAILSMYVAKNKRFSGSYFLEYADLLELWIKMPALTEQLMYSAGGRRIESVERDFAVWTFFRQGVDKREAESFVNVLIADILSLEYSDYIGSLQNHSANFEVQLSKDAVQKAEFDKYYTRVKSWKQGDALLKENEAAIEYTLKKNAGLRLDTRVLFVEATRRGSKTRLDVFFNGSNWLTMEYASAQDFLRQLRGFSLQTAKMISRSRATTSVQSRDVDLNRIGTGTAVPKNLVQIKRIAATGGGIPLGGFYIGKYEVTQREFETLMGYNPSLVKGADLPVNNVKLQDATEYCNALSLRDGLQPAYLVLYYDEEAKFEIKIFPDASGYRLPTADEWLYACGDGIRDEASGWFAPNSGGKIHPVGQKKPNNFGLYDMFGNVDEYIHEKIPSDRVIAKRSGANSVRSDGGNYLGTIREPKKKTVSDSKVTGFRIVRPVFDYWKYQSGSYKQ
ncbi:hypothetical protein AGMMS49928_16960 [Spirochaetia bacterium]|nr:hypothetical protein AGMMS49928_16960 [Spirochaetia bacterium]